jgi:aryl-alcohol dehydrogenase-like predicted oxidoreductase
MQYRKFGRTNWQVSEIGYGMWGLAGWTGSDDKEVEASLHKAVELGCNFFDTAWGYGAGRSEQILGKLIKAYLTKIYAATKLHHEFQIGLRSGYKLEESFSCNYIIEIC